MATSDPCRLVILVSGSGSNLQSFIDHINDGKLDAQISAVLCNRPGAFAIERAKAAEITAQVIDHTLYDSRETFDQALIESIDRYQPDLVILAGFMRILTSQFVQHFYGRLVNIHPSLLPKYPGLNTHQRAIDAGDDCTGATVHFVTEELDGGPAIIQAGVKIEPDDDAHSLAARLLSVEHRIYPLAAQWFAAGRLQLNNNQVLLDDKALPENGHQYLP